MNILAFDTPCDETAAAGARAGRTALSDDNPVSYTHLKLPAIYSV